MIIIHLSVHIRILSILIISHVWYTSIIIINDVQIIIFYGSTLNFLGSNTINGNSIMSLYSRRATPSHWHAVILNILLCLAFVNKRTGGRGGGGGYSQLPILIQSVKKWYWVPSFLEARTNNNKKEFHGGVLLLT